MYADLDYSAGPVRIGSLCTGYGGLDMAVETIFGGELAWWSDIEPGPIKLMTHHRPDVPNLGDLKLVDWSAVRPIEILTAGYPCQPFSNAGKRLGTDDPRHIWPWIAEGIGVLRPRFVVLENVASHLRRGFDVVSADLADVGYRVTWGIVSAADAGAPHLRKRLYIVAEDADRAASGERRLSAPGQAEGRGARSDAGGRSGTPSPDAGRHARQEDHANELATAGRGRAAADADGVGRERGGNVLEPDIARGGPADHGQPVAGLEQVFGDFAPAVARWEHVLGRVAPSPRELSPRGNLVLSASFVEWMMGLPAGHVIDVPGMSRSAALKLLGNGVVPQQAERAIRMLLSNLEESREWH